MLKKIAAISVYLLLCISLTACKKPAFLEKLNFFKKQQDLSLNEVTLKARQGDTDALKRLQEAAEQNNADAQNRLGVIYANGTVVMKNEKLAAYWFQKAAELEDAAAQVNLASAYKNGAGLPQDNSKAFYWLKRAAEHGNSIAQNSLGNMFMIGEGIPQDDAKASYWYQKAADQGNVEAKKNLQKLQEKSTNITNSNSNTIHQPTSQTSPSVEKNVSTLKNIFDKLKKNSSKIKSAHPGNEEPEYLK